MKPKDRKYRLKKKKKKKEENMRKQPDPTRDQIAFLILHIPHTTYVIFVSLFIKYSTEEKKQKKVHRHMPIIE